MDVSDRRLQVQLTPEAKIASDFSLVRAIFVFAGFVSALRRDSALPHAPRAFDRPALSSPVSKSLFVSLQSGFFDRQRRPESAGRRFFCAKAPARGAAHFPLFAGRAVIPPPGSDC